MSMLKSVQDIYAFFQQYERHLEAQLDPRANYIEGSIQFFQQQLYKMILANVKHTLMSLQRYGDILHDVNDTSLDAKIWGKLIEYASRAKEALETESNTLQLRIATSFEPADVLRLRRISELLGHLKEVIPFIFAINISPQKSWLSTSYKNMQTEINRHIVQPMVDSPIRKKNVEGEAILFSQTVAKERIPTTSTTFLMEADSRPRAKL